MMLEEIRIQNFAIIDYLTLSFAPGLNVITGETGAGKSIIIDAVDLLLGGKPDAAFVRAGADKTIIEGVFSVSGRIEAPLLAFLKQADLIDEDATNVPTLTLTREVRSNGRSTARINGVSVNQDLLREVGEALVDVHGQSDHFSLLRASTHIDFLDSFADLIKLREALAALVNKLFDVRAEIKQLMDDKAALQRRIDRLRSDLEEIDAAELVPGEDEELRSERNRLANSEQLAKLTGEALMLLNGDDAADGFVSAMDALAQVGGLLRKLAQIDPSLVEARDAAELLLEGVDDLGTTIRRYAESVEYNPARLDEVEERLELINSLKRRLNCQTIDQILAYGERARAELETLENSEERLEELRGQEAKLLKFVGDSAARISELRVSAAERLSAGVVNELADLRMANTRFEVSIEQTEDPDGCIVGERRFAFDVTGIDQVEFLMSANPGMPLRPLAKVASGGEAARIMLALKRVLSQADNTPTLIFDEIDQGIGGRVGSVVGEKLWALTGEHQVLVVTHLAQLAGYADQHYRVTKVTEADMTRTQIVALTDERLRVEELAAMLGATNDSGLQTAHELLREALAFKRDHGAVSRPPAQPQLL